MKTELEKLTELLGWTKRLVQSQKRFDALSKKCRDMRMDTHTPRAIGKANAELDWHAMEHDKLKHDLHAISVDCGLSEPRESYDVIDYHPSAFHHYQHKPRVPECRK